MKDKSDNIIIDHERYKNLSEGENKSLLSIERNIIEWKKCLFIIIRNY